MKAFLAALALFALLCGASCASHPEIGKPDDWPTALDETRLCLMYPEAKAFLDDVHERVLRQWELPPGVRPNRTVVIGFFLDGNGHVARSAVFEAENRALARSALRALRESDPFRIPVGAECFIGLPIVATFSNPTAP